MIDTHLRAYSMLIGVGCRLWAWAGAGAGAGAFGVDMEGAPLFSLSRERCPSLGRCHPREACAVPPAIPCTS